MGMFCPLIKDECKKSECVMWNDGKCILIEAIKEIAYGYASPEEPHDIQPKIDTKPKIDLNKLSPEEIASMVLNFFKEKLPNRSPKQASSTEVISMFLEERGFNLFSLPTKLRFKIEEARDIILSKIADEERKMMPQLIKECVEWAKSNGLKKVRQTDIELFLIERRIKLTYESQKLLYAKVNMELKNK